MAYSVNDLQVWIATELDQSANPATTLGTDWNIRMNFLNRSNLDWAKAYDWRCLKVIHNGLVSTSVGNASYALPTNFDRLDGFPKIVSDGVTTYEFPSVDPSRNREYVDSDKYVNILGNETDGKTMYIHAATLASGASVSFTYWKSPASLATTNQLLECPDPTYLVQRTLYYLYKGREDGRFPEAKAEADKILARMIENENTQGLSSLDRKIPVGDPQYKNFRIGRD